MARLRHIALLTVVLGATAGVAQQKAPAPTPPPNTYVGKAIGKATVDNSPSYTTTNLYVNQQVVTDTSNHLHVISRGNTLIFTPNTRFHTRVNAYELESGGSKVASYTGMTAYLPNCFSVTPVDPNLMTLFEVNWSGEQTAYVYARSNDVRIRYWAKGAPKLGDPATPSDQDWVVRQGHFAQIPNVPGCKPILLFGPEPGVPADVAAVAATAAAPIPALIIWQRKPNISQPNP